LYQNFKTITSITDISVSNDTVYCLNLEQKKEEGRNVSVRDRDVMTEAEVNEKEI